MNLKAKFINLFRGNVNISKKISAGLLAFMIMLSPLTPIVNANSSQPNSGTTKAGTQIDVKKPSVNPVLYGATTISGANLAKAKVNKKTVIATVYVTLKGENGTVKATLSVTPTSGTKWSVKLPEGKKLKKVIRLLFINK